MDDFFFPLENPPKTANPEKLTPEYTGIRLPAEGWIRLH